MKQTKKGTTIILQDDKKDIKLFLSTIAQKYEDFKSQNLILDISLDATITVSDLLNCKEIARKHKKANQSFVVVTPVFDYDSLPEYLNIVPTMQEAHDIIEMEEIERDLGF